MSRKIEFPTKPSRNDRFAQMSRQEQVIEQKKREIQARLQQQQKEKSTPASTSSTTKPTSVETKKPSKPLWKGNLGNKPNHSSKNKFSTQFNVFSNDGSFLDQFKQLSDSKKNFDPKITISSIKSDKVRDNQDRMYSDERNKPSRWSKFRSQSMNFYVQDELPPIKNKISRFSDPPPCDMQPLVQQPQIITSFTQAPTFSTNDIFVNNFSIQPPMTVQTAQPLQQQAIQQMQQPPPLSVINHQLNAQINSISIVTSTTPMLVPPPLTIASVPPPQIVQNNNIGALIAPPPPHASITNQPMAGGGISVPPPILSVPVSRPTCTAPLPVGIELTSIPAPNPIPVHTIPQPEPINTLTIPPPAPLQLQNIPSPSPIRLNEIPNPKPIDLLNIPAPGEEPKMNKPMTDPDFIKNVPPPNKSVPPPALGTVTEFPNVNIPPPITTPTAIPPPTSVPPPLHPSLQQLPLPQQLQVSVNNVPHTQQLIGTVSTSNIPSLMAQPVLPPPGMTRVGPLPPPPSMSVSQTLVTIMPPVNVTALPGPPPVLNQPPPLAQTNQIPPMNFPPPLGPPPNVNLNINAPPPGIDLNAGSASHDAMVSLGRMVAQCGSGIEDIVQQRSAQDPSLWFLFHKHSAAYHQYRQLVEQFRAEVGANSLAGKKHQEVIKLEYHPDDIYEPENITDDELQSHDSRNMGHETPNNLKDDYDRDSIRKRKRKSRWGEKVIDTNLIVQPRLSQRSSTLSTPMLSKVTRNDPGLIQYAINTFGSSNLSEDDWKKAEDHYKINLLYQDMVRKRQEVERLQKAGRNKYEYDSDEETDGGTWEHKLRMQEMKATQMWANELTRQSEGKHHIGDFLPPDELKNFMEKYSAAKEGRQPNLSDYKEFKLKEDNIGFKMLQKLGWQEGQGLGSEGTGIVEPVNKATIRDQNQGLGMQEPDGIGNHDDEYDAYRKRMMLAYKFRPNPLNNPRRPYY